MIWNRLSDILAIFSGIFRFFINPFLIHLKLDFCCVEQHQPVALWVCVFVFHLSKQFFRPFLGKKGGWNLVCWLYSHKWKINKGVMIGGRHPWVEDNLWWKITFGGRRPSVEQPLVEEGLRQKTTFAGRQLSVEDNFLWKTTFCWKTTYEGRRP